jgi:hypothetical protein
MLAYVYDVLGSFRSVFSRHRTWLLFVMVVIGFIGATQIGVPGVIAGKFTVSGIS